MLQLAKTTTCECYLCESYDISFLSPKNQWKIYDAEQQELKAGEGQHPFGSLNRPPRMDVAFCLLGMGLKRQHGFISHLIFPTKIQTGSMAPSFLGGMQCLTCYSKPGATLKTNELGHSSSKGYNRVVSNTEEFLEHQQKNVFGGLLKLNSILL